MRRCTIDDLPWILSLGYHRYGPYDPGPVVLRIAQIIASPDTYIMRTDHALCIATLDSPVWRVKAIECHVMILAAYEGYHWEAVKLLKGSVQWAADRDCYRWWFGSETSSEVDAICKRVGAEVGSTRYKIEIAAIRNRQEIEAVARGIGEEFADE